MRGKLRERERERERDREREREREREIQVGGEHTFGIIREKRKNKDQALNALSLWSRVDKNSHVIFIVLRAEQSEESERASEQVSAAECASKVSSVEQANE